MAKPSAGKRGKGKGVTLNSAGQLPAVAEVRPQHHPVSPSGCAWKLRRKQPHMHTPRSTWNLYSLPKTVG